MDKNFNLPTLQFATKSEIEVMAKDYAEKILASGNQLDVMIAMTVTQEFFKQLENSIGKQARKIADKLCGTKSTIEYKGVQIQMKEPAVQYDWKAVPFIAKREEELKKIKDGAKGATPSSPFIYMVDGKILAQIDNVPKKESKRDEDDEYVMSIIIPKK